MSDARAFVYNIDPNGTVDGEDNSIHQTSPAWVLTFIRWQNRDTLRDKTDSPTATRDPLIVENDCLQLSTSVNKGTLTPSFTATLVMTDVNYETAVAPGDFVTINMLNWQADARRVADQARAKKPVNGIDDGFKGIFKVQGVRRVITTDPQTGTRIVLFRINGYAFTEFNNTVYFNPYLIDPNQEQSNQLLFASYVGRDWTKMVNDKGLVNVQDILAFLVQSLIGNGITDDGRIIKGIVRSPNVHFFIPKVVGKLLGVVNAKAAKDIYTFLFGIQKYAAGSASDASTGLNPSGLSIKFGRFYYTPLPCDGKSLLKAEYWNQVKTWSILNQYTNSPLNELYTCFRLSPNNRVMPTVVFRQIPFTNEDFSGTNSVTRFLNLPRWKINPALILEQDVGRDEAARINFVQYFGRSTLGQNGADIAQQNAQINYLYDVDDVQRSGLRPYIVTTQFDDPTSKNKEYRSPGWSKILGDTLIGGHLKLNGSITCAGIVDPIAVGDNLEFDGIVYHIEQISHNCSISPTDGKVAFRTMINISSGVSIDSNSSGTVYGEMSDTAANDLRIDDFDNNEILPGVSESQDVESRGDAVDSVTPEESTPFGQPNTGVKMGKLSGKK